MYIWISSCIFLMPNRVKSAERQIEIWRAVRTCHSEPVRTLVWESPSNFGQPIVIQTVLLRCFLEFFHEKWYFYPGDSHTSDVGHWFAMTGKSIARQIPICKGVGEAFRLPQQAGKSPKRVGRSGKEDAVQRDGKPVPYEENRYRVLRQIPICISASETR